jgi:prevent-host-death family protein
MRERVSAMSLRTSLGDLLNRVDLRHDEFVVERKGRPLAAIVSIAKLEQMERFARERAAVVLQGQIGGDASQEEADGIGAEAKAWARKQAKKTAGHR